MSDVISMSLSKSARPFSPSFTSSMMKLQYTFLGWNFLTRLQAACIVPPVASRSSCSRITSFSLMASLWISMVSLPYSLA